MIDVNQIALLAKSADNAKANPAGGRPYVVITKGADEVVEYLQPAPDRPPHAKGCHVVHSLDSFIELYERLTSVPVEGRPQIYVSALTKPSFTAVLNDHDLKGGALRDFRITYAPAFSRQWQTWTAQNRQPKNQDQFASLLEDNMADVLTPDGATLLEMVLKFELTRTMTFKSSKRLNNGNFALVYSDEGTAGESLNLPQKILLRIPVFHGGDLVEVSARLKFKLKEEKLNFWYEMESMDDTVEAQVNKIASRIASDTAQVLIQGEA